jgi:geranylgeranyl pyrophosphate synthase
MAFQGMDDILDVTAPTSRLGKTAGKDVAAGKATWLRLEDLESARRRVSRYGRRGTKLLSEALPAGAASERLLGLAALMWERDR